MKELFVNLVWQKKIKITNKITLIIGNVKNILHDILFWNVPTIMQTTVKIGPLRVYLPLIGDKGVLLYIYVCLKDSHQQKIIEN